MTRKPEPPVPILKRAHELSSHHRKVVEESGLVGCYCCCEVYPPSEIQEWTDEAQTAICPRCGIDSVLPSLITPQFLGEMERHWFNLASRRDHVRDQDSELRP